jgi:transposase-like protein
MAVSFKGAHFPPEMILPCVRWYVAYPLSTRPIEELMLARGVHVDHSTVNRWVITYSPQLEEAFHRRKRPVWVSWCMDETYIKIKGTWYYRHRRARFRDEALRAGWGDAPRAVRPPWLSPPPPLCGGLLACVR